MTESIYTTEDTPLVVYILLSFFLLSAYRISVRLLNLCTKKLPVI